VVAAEGVMQMRAPLNGLQPRESREAARNPYDWWEPPEPTPRRTRIADALFAIALGIAIGWSLAWSL
jgi:hypothetical protein